MNNKVIGYTRVSTDKQANEGVSLDAQKVAITKWAELNAPELDVVFFSDEGVSGAVSDRAGLTEAMNAISKGDILVVYSLSRLARSTKQTIEISDLLQKRGADLVSLTEKIDTTTAAGKMVFRMLAVLNEFERDQISERTSAALQYKKSQGERVGHVPYGFTTKDGSKKLVKETTEQMVLMRVLDMRRSGMSFRLIATELYKQGIKNRTNKPFSHVTIKGLCDREGVTC